MHELLFTWQGYLYGLACTVAGFVVGLAAPRIWRFMNTTFAGGS
jgi:hypothetical protein